MSTTEATGTKGQRVETFAGLVWKRFKKHKLALYSAVILLVLIATSLLAGVYESLLDVSYEATSLKNRYGPYEWPHILGTDDVGRDVMARLLHGGRVSLAVGIISALSSATIGTIIGLFAGYYGGWLDSLLMRFTDAMLSVPVLPLMIVFAAIDLQKLFDGAGALDDALWTGVLFAALILIVNLWRARDAELPMGKALKDGSIGAGIAALVLVVLYVAVGKGLAAIAGQAGNLASVLKIILIIVFFGWMTVARLARAAALQIKGMEFVTAARALGASDRRILMQHVLPNAMAPIIVAATLEVGGNILYEAALSFLGLGIQPPVPSWGNMLNLALDYIKQDPLLAFWPGAFILVCVACFNFFGDGMRDALDPHQVMKDG